MSTSVFEVAPSIPSNTKAHHAISLEIDPVEKSLQQAISPFVCAPGRHPKRSSALKDEVKQSLWQRLKGCISSAGAALETCLYNCCCRCWDRSHVGYHQLSEDPNDTNTQPKGVAYTIL